MDHRLIQPNDKLELKLSSEMDDTLLKSIQDEYFKKTCVYPLIAILISLSVMALWISEVIPKTFGQSDIYDMVFLILVPLSGGVICLDAVRCIISLQMISGIKNREFRWYAGSMQGLRWRFPGTYTGFMLYYSVDGKYFGQILLNPFYRKGTEVYFLHFPGMSGIASTGGIIVHVNGGAAVSEPQSE
jgi:hypothetical protein